LATPLIVLKQAVERSGYQVRSYAPTTKAAKQLAESGIETQTLQRFIRQSRQLRASDNHLELAASPSIAFSHHPGEGGRAAEELDYRTHGRPVIYVLDESSLASTRNLNSFFDRIGPHDKILLVGDTRQHQAIEAGSPFEQFQMRGMTTAKLTKIVRQNDASLKRVVEHLSAREIHAAVAGLAGKRAGH